MSERLYRVTATLKDSDETHVRLLSQSDTYDLVYKMVGHVLNDNVHSEAVRQRTMAFIDRVDMSGTATLTDTTSMTKVDSFYHGEYEDYES